MTGITVCITHHDRLDKLRRALDRLEETTTVDYKVRIHNNGVLDADIEAYLTAALSGNGPVEEVFHTANNIGIGPSRALLLSEIDTEYALVLDDDMLVEEGWDDAMLSVMDAESVVGVVGAPFMTTGDGGITDGGQHVTRSGGVLNRSHTDYSVLADPDTDYVTVDDTPMGSSLIRREVLTDVQLDDRYEIGFEDLDFSLQVAEAGWEIAMTAQTVFYHDKRDIDAEYTRTRRDYSTIRESYWTLVETWGERFPLTEHVYVGYVFGLPNRLLWSVGSLKDRVSLP